MHPQRKWFTAALIIWIPFVVSSQAPFVVSSQAPFVVSSQAPFVVSSSNHERNQDDNRSSSDALWTSRT
jgi:hypothetical protein